MGGEAESIGAAEARSALAWWLEAGVDVAVQEEPRDWLKPAAPETAGEAHGAPPNVAPPTHETLAELQEWLSSSAQLPLASSAARRIMPQGPENAAVMLLTDAPTLEDFAAGQPIGGESWELAKRMLAAIKIPAEEAYSASLSCFHVPGARMSATDREAAPRSRAVTSVWRNPSACFCSATDHRRRFLESRSPRPAAMPTKSRASGRSRPSIPGT